MFLQFLQIFFFSQIRESLTRTNGKTIDRSFPLNTGKPVVTFYTKPGSIIIRTTRRCVCACVCVCIPATARHVGNGIRETIITCICLCIPKKIAWKIHTRAYVNADFSLFLLTFLRLSFSLSLSLSPSLPPSPPRLSFIFAPLINLNFGEASTEASARRIPLSSRRKSFVLVFFPCLELLNTRPAKGTVFGMETKSARIILTEKYRFLIKLRWRPLFRRNESGANVIIRAG